MSYVNLAGSPTNNAPYDAGGISNNSAFAIGFTLTEKLTINAVKINRNQAILLPATVGIASAIFPDTSTIVYMVKRDDANLNGTGLILVDIPQVTLNPGVRYYVIQATPGRTPGQQCNAAELRCSNGPNTWSANITSGEQRVAAFPAGGWGGGTSYIPNFEIGTNLPVTVPGGGGKKSINDAMVQQLRAAVPNSSRMTINDLMFYSKQAAGPSANHNTVDDLNAVAFGVRANKQTINDRIYRTYGPSAGPDSTHKSIQDVLATFFGAGT